jgi:hypothetical protein
MDIQCNSLGKKRQSTKTNVRTISTVSFSVDIVRRLATIYYHGLNKKKTKCIFAYYVYCQKDVNIGHKLKKDEQYNGQTKG